MADDKTEAPTPRRQAELRKRGDVAQSAELSAAVTLLAAVYLMAGRLPVLMQTLAGLMRDSFIRVSQPEQAIAGLGSTGQTIAAELARDLLPFLLGICGLGIVVSLTQTRGLISMHKLMPDPSRVNPISGLKRIFSAQGLMETGKGIFKMLVLGLVLYPAVRDAPPQLAKAAQTGIGPGITALGQILEQMARQAAMLLLLSGGLDYLVQWRQHQSRAKMTKQEVAEEMKSAEGQPMIRARIRQMQRRWSRQRMMQELASADVIVTNPTHMAIALRYDAKAMSAPAVVAKGKGLIAEQIKRRAEELGIPIIENVPLAHALIHVELGAQIPAALYEAVAEVLAFVYRLKANRGTQRA